MTPVQRRPVRESGAASAWRTDGIVMASLWTLVAILLAGIAVGPGLC